MCGSPLAFHVKRGSVGCSSCFHVRYAQPAFHVKRQPGASSAPLEAGQTLTPTIPRETSTLPARPRRQPCPVEDERLVAHVHVSRGTSWPACHSEVPRSARAHRMARARRDPASNSRRTGGSGRPAALFQPTGPDRIPGRRPVGTSKVAGYPASPRAPVRDGQSLRTCTGSSSVQTGTHSASGLRWSPGTAGWPRALDTSRARRLVCYAAAYFS